MLFLLTGMQIKMSQSLVPGGWMAHDEKVCRRRARDAEWKFRVSKGYEKDTFWNKVRFCMTHKD